MNSTDVPRTVRQYRIPKFKVSVIRDRSETSPIRKISDSGQIFSFLREYYEGHDREEMLAVILDAKHTIIGLHTVSIGTLTLSLVHPRETFKAAILMSAGAVILAHNHPSGDPTPSREDRTLTDRLVKAGDLLGIPVIDHVIVGDDCYVSFADEGWLHPGSTRDSSS
jgi:DNA repair protein RadC